MSMMELPSGAIPKSTLNPDAPLFIPMAFQQVQDFSPEWWELVKTTTWFREHWFHVHQDQETFDEADGDEDVANLLPDSIDLEIGNELSMIAADTERASLQQSVLEDVAMNTDMLNLGFLNNAEINFGSRAPKNDIRALSEHAKYREKPVQRMSPKFASRHFIQQPR
ncbi:protein EARLY RESPONSIVE TO DEHYDRATION 15-like [Zingiber officinale]|nr:protein EARLY RESPONSIVE TO DEHYDRATION 15-like [Zingiber officinale]